MSLTRPSITDIVVPIKTPSHLMIVHDKDTAGALKVIRGIAEGIKTGMVISPSNALPDIVMKGLAQKKNGLDLSQISLFELCDYKEFVPNIINHKHIGITPISPLEEQNTENDGMVHKAITHLLMERKSDLRQPAFLLMVGSSDADISDITSQARACGVVIITMIHQPELLTMDKEHANALIANHKNILHSSQIASAVIQDGSLVISYAYD